MSTPDDYDDGYGPPSWEDDAWFHEHVRAAGYPKVKRDPKPAEGQMSLTDALPDYRVQLGVGDWHLGGTGIPNLVVKAKEPGWYRWSRNGWVRDENQDEE